MVLCSTGKLTILEATTGNANAVVPCVLFVDSKELDINSCQRELLLWRSGLCGYTEASLLTRNKTSQAHYLLLLTSINSYTRCCGLTLNLRS